MAAILNSSDFSDSFLFSKSGEIKKVETLSSWLKVLLSIAPGALQHILMTRASTLKTRTEMGSGRELQVLSIEDIGTKT